MPDRMSAKDSADAVAGVRLILKGARYRTGLCTAETEIEKPTAETGARNPPRKSRNTGNCRPETGAPQTGMSAILPHQEITARRPDCVADEPVAREPVSGRKFPAETELAYADIRIVAAASSPPTREQAEAIVNNCSGVSDGE
jgi:hypothetical protein